MDTSKIFIVIAIAAVTIVLLLGLFNMMKGGDAGRSQTLMRWRVVLQAVAIGVIMISLWAFGK